VDAVENAEVAGIKISTEVGVAAQVPKAAMAEDSDEEFSEDSDEEFSEDSDEVGCSSDGSTMESKGELDAAGKAFLCSPALSSGLSPDTDLE